MPSAGKWMLLSALVGLAAGLAAICFQTLFHFVQYVGLQLVAGFPVAETASTYSVFPESSREFWPLGLLLLLTFGGWFAGWLAWKFAPAAAGPGTGAAIDAFHNRRGEIAIQIPIVKTIASAITLGTGGSAGHEGPVAQIGAGIGAWIATRLHLSARDRRILLAAGMGAGVGAIFRAPLAGALFAGEILYRDAELEADVIMPSAVASTVAYSLFCFSMPVEYRFMPLFGNDLQFDLTTPLELIPYAFLACVMAGAGILYVQIVAWTNRVFDRWAKPVYWKSCLGAFLSGVIGLAVYYALGRDDRALATLGSGYGLLQSAFTSLDELAVGTLLVVALVKIVTTSLTVGSGGSGGVFGPAMVVGGCAGSAVGKLMAVVWPQVVTQPATFTVVGMAGFFAGCARAPFSTILMVTELTGSYRLLVPAMWVSTLCFFMMRRWTLYPQQVETRLDSPAHRGDFIIDVLEGMSVSDVYQKDVEFRHVYEGRSLNEIVHLFAETSQRYFPVVDRDDRLVGIFSTEDVRSYLYDDTIWEIANAGDVMNTKVVTVTPDDDLNTALSKFTVLNVDELPVVDAEEPRKILGVLRHKETIDAYNRKRIEHQSQQEL